MLPILATHICNAASNDLWPFLILIVIAGIALTVLGMLKFGIIGKKE